MKKMKRTLSILTSPFFQEELKDGGFIIWYLWGLVSGTVLLVIGLLAREVS